MTTNFPRHIKDRLLLLANQFPVILVTGARQIGKTTLLRETFADAPFATLDLPSLAYEAENNGQAFISSFGDAKRIILDEVQYAPALFRSLKIEVDANRHTMGRFLMTGSQKFALMQNVTESLAGRVMIIEMDTLSAAEILDALPLSPPPVADLIWRGGYPELWRMPELQPRDFFSSYLATYLERDVRQLVNVTNLRDFERFIRMCAIRTGNLVNLDALASDVGISGSTARQWLSVLETSNIITLLQPYFGNHGKRMIKTPKLFFKDTGLACFLLGISTTAQLMDSPFVGALWESFVLGQINRARVSDHGQAEVYFWRDAHGTEVDFVIWLNGRLQLVEVKWAENGGATEYLKSMNKVRTELGDAASDRHLLVCRTPTSHWHPHDPTVRVVNGYYFRDWFNVPMPPSFVLREDPPAYTTPSMKKPTRKTLSAKKKR